MVIYGYRKNPDHSVADREQKEKNLGLRFSGPLLLVGHYEVFRRLKKKRFSIVSCL